MTQPAIEPDLELFDHAQVEQLMQASQWIAPLRDLVKRSQEVLIERFQQGVSVKTLIRQRAWFVDQLLQSLWQRIDWPTDVEISLLAVGGYGRGELNLHSDIDLLLLLQDDEAEACRDAIETFLMALWDVGLEVGHSVRTVAQCVEEAGKDITIATNMMEARTLCGSDRLRETMQALTTRDQVWTGPAFFEAKLKEQFARHRKHNNTEYNLEPHIKDAPGGLRDIQTIGWVAKRHFDAETLKDLVTHQFLTEDEYSILDAGQTFFWKVRFALHMITGRDENRLLFDHQRAVAEQLGYKDTDNNLAVEQFMQRYYRAALAISELNEVLMQHFDEAILNGSGDESVSKINSRFQIRNGYIEIAHEKVFEYTPPALLEVFVLMAQDPSIKGVRAQTIRAIRDHRHLIDEDFRNDIRNISLFMELLRSPYKLFTQLRRMKRYGVLGQYIPAFGQVIGKMQYDLFHIYTVDAHTLLVIRNMRRFRHKNAREEFPVASRLVHQLPKIELLYLAGFFHDIAKGRGGDHSELGATDAREFCLHHRLSRWDANLVAWLVEHHLLMSMTSQKKDVSDPEVIQEFTRIVGDEIRLDYLYTLTVADICATNPNLWNGWRASLLRQLYTEAKRALRRGLDTTIDKQEWIQDTRNQALIWLRADNITEGEVEGIWSELGDDYFLRHSAREIAWHAKAILDHTETNRPLVLLRESEDRKYEGGTQIFVYTEDRPNLFAATVAAMDQLGLTILDARIMSSQSNFSLDTYIVVDENGSPIGNAPGRIKQIQQKLTETLSDPDEFPEVVQRRMPRQLKHFDVATEVIVSNDLSNQLTVIEVRTLDRPGLLAQIGQLFAEYHLSIVNARIATLGERAEDVFFVTDTEGNPVSDPTLLQGMRKRLVQELDQTLAQQAS